MMQREHSGWFLVVEDERALAQALSATIERSGVQVERAATAALAREALMRREFLGMVLDIGLPDENGLEFYGGLPEVSRVPALVVTAHGGIENTIEARKLGVREFFSKPVDFEGFRNAVRQLVSEAGPVTNKGSSESRAPGAAYIGAAPSMRPVFQQIAHACAGDFPVLVSGATGSGRTKTAELIERNQSGVRENARVIYNPATGSPEQMERAIREAAGGLLRIDPVAGLSNEEADVLLSCWERETADFPRVIAVAGENIRAEIEAGRIASELYYRLQVMEIRLPRLSERREDIPALFTLFLGERGRGETIEIPEEVYRVLEVYSWPGNVRELRNVATYAEAVRGGRRRIGTEHLPDHLVPDERPASDADLGGLGATLDRWLDQYESLPTYRELSGRLEALLVERLLIRFDGKLAPLAHALEANRSTLRKRLRDSRRGPT